MHTIDTSETEYFLILLWVLQTLPTPDSQTIKEAKARGLVQNGVLPGLIGGGGGGAGRHDLSPDESSNGCPVMVAWQGLASRNLLSNQLTVFMHSTQSLYSRLPKPFLYIYITSATICRM